MVGVPALVPGVRLLGRLLIGPRLLSGLASPAPPSMLESLRAMRLPRGRGAGEAASCPPELWPELPLDALPAKGSLWLSANGLRLEKRERGEPPALPLPEGALLLPACSPPRLRFGLELAEPAAEVLVLRPARPEAAFSVWLRGPELGAPAA